MITKDRLLAGLFELEYVEEGVVTLYANFTKGLVEHTDGMEESKKKEIKKMLTHLYRDSARHKTMIDEFQHPGYPWLILAVHKVTFFLHEFSKVNLSNTIIGKLSLLPLWKIC